MQFSYRARNKQGDIFNGSIEASSKDAAVSLLRDRGLYATFLEEAETSIYNKEIRLFERITKKDVIIFSRQLSIMFKSSISLIEALRALSRETTNVTFRECLFRVSEDVEGGSAFSQALARYPKIFPVFYISVIRSGEASGKLSDSLNYLSEHLEREYHLTSKVKGAMVYPAFVVFVIFGVFIVLIFFVMPNLIEVFEATGQELPAATRAVIATTKWFQNWWFVSLIVTFGLIGLITRYWRTKDGKRFFDGLFLKIPIIGSFLKLIHTSRFAENLSTLISSGLPIIHSLEIVNDIVNNTHYQEAIFEAKERVGKGEMISVGLNQHSELFSPVFTQMISVGEKTGRLPELLMNVADFYQKEIDRSIEGILGILEPILIVFLGIAVAGIMLSVLLPMYQLASF